MDKNKAVTTFEDMEEKELFKLFQNGNQNATEEILNRYKNLVTKIARRYYIIGMESDDVIQTGMVALFKAMRNYNGVDNFSAYAKVVIRNDIITEIKKSAPIDVVDNDFELMPLSTNAGEPLEELLGSELESKLKGFMQSECSKLEKEVLQLFLNGWKYKEIAEKLNKSAKSIDNTIQRIKYKLKKVLGE